MTTALQQRRGTSSNHATFTGLDGEITVNTTNKSVHVHDGATAGGFELLREDLYNLTDITTTVTFSDNSELRFGTGSDMTIKHDSTATDNIINTNSSLKIQTNSSTKLEINDAVNVTGEFNVNSGIFKVDNTGSANAKYYLKMGDYGEGNFFGKHGSVNGANYTLGVGSEGKLVEDMKIATFALNGDAFLNLHTEPKVLIPAVAGKAHIIHDVLFYVDYTAPDGCSAGGFDNASGNCYGIGIPATTPYGGGNTFYSFAGLPVAITRFEAGDFLWAGDPEDDYRVIPNRDILLRAPHQHEITNSANVPGGTHYVKIRYTTISLEGDFRSIGGLNTLT